MPIFKENGNAYRRVKLLEQPVKGVNRELERRIRELMNVDEMQFDFLPGKKTTVSLFVVRRM